MIESDANLPVVSPEVPAAEEFRDPKAAVDRLNTLYKIAVDFLTETFSSHVVGARPDTRFRAFYPEIRFRTATFAQTDSRLSFGHVPGPGTYATTITRPDLFEGYLEQQIALLIENHDEPVVIGVSDTAMPVHFAVSGEVAVPQEGALQFTLRDVFDVPDLATTNDDIVNGIDVLNEDGSKPLAPFHRTTDRLLPRALATLHSNERRAFSESCSVHKLPVLCGGIRSLRPRDAGG